MQFMNSRLGRFLRRRKRQPKRLYLDYAAATPVLPAVADVMNTLTRTLYGNPGAIHQEGADAAQVVADARLSIARTLGVRPPEVFFTASGTEANNLAIYGLIEGLVKTGRAYTEMEIISTAIEHPSVLEVLKDLAARGVTVHCVPLTEVGKIDVVALQNLWNDRTVLMTFAYANSEIGVVQDVTRITRLLRKYNTEHGTAIKTHLDAAQAPLWLSCQVHQLGVDMMALDAGKCHGPKGVGMLVKRADTTLAPLVHGGGQESGLRAGTENPVGITGAAVALKDAQDTYKERSAAVYAVSQVLVAKLKEAIPNVVFNGPEFTDFEQLERLPHNVHISIPGLDTEFAVIVLDKHGIAASTKSACSGAGGGASTVVEAISGDSDRASATIRFTLDPTLILADMDRVVHTLSDHVVQMQSLDF